MAKRKVTPISEETGRLFDTAIEAAASQTIERKDSIPGIRLGTSAFTAAGWETAFYPKGMAARDYLSYYATKFNSVEVDSTFYRCPPGATFNRWYQATPPDFTFSLKVPQTITHEKILVDCNNELDEFMTRADLLDDKLGVLLLQFPYFNKKVFKGPVEFYERLRFFLQNVSGSTLRFAIEIRNKNWLTVEFANVLREYKVALTLQDQLWMPLPDAMHFEYFTAPFTYIRLLGDRHGIEKLTKAWDKVIVNRSKEIQSWVDVCKRAVHRGVTVYIYINNHYSGFAPATVARFVKAWNR